MIIKIKENFQTIINAYEKKLNKKFNIKNSINRIKYFLFEIIFNLKVKIKISILKQKIILKIIENLLIKNYPKLIY
jgi:hypothetical protein